MDWGKELQGGQLQRLLGRMADGYLHQGQDLPRVEDWCRYWVSAPGTLRVTVEQIDLDLESGLDPEGLSPEGTSATVGYTLRIESCDSEEEDAVCSPLLGERMLPGNRTAWLSHLRKIDGRWQPTGDGKSIGLEVVSLHRGSSYLLDVRLHDPGRTVQAARVVGPGAEAGIALEPIASGEWRFEEQPLIAASVATLPAPPIVYDVELSTSSGASTEQVALPGFVDEFATLLAPAGEVAQPIVFHWAGNGALRHYQLRVLGAEGPLWISPEVADTTLPYAGPALTAGVEYPYEVWTFDSFGDASVNEGSFIPLPDAVLTPRLSAVSPQAGPAAGGAEVVLDGASFQAGARVLFGEEEATSVRVDDPSRIRCTTPAGTPGTVNVLVINPGERVALLERGYTFQ